MLLSVVGYCFPLLINHLAEILDFIRKMSGLILKIQFANTTFVFTDPKKTTKSLRKLVGVNTQKYMKASIPSITSELSSRS